MRDDAVRARVEPRIRSHAAAEDRLLLVALGPDLNAFEK